MVSSEESAICKCFKSAEGDEEYCDAVALPSYDVDPFLEADVRMELEGLMERLWIWTVKIGKLTFWQSLDEITQVEMTESMNHGEKPG